jgi:replicative DNA helicase
MNEEALLISSVLNGVPISRLAKHKVSSREFVAYKDEMAFLERHGGEISKSVFRGQFEDFKIKKVDPKDFDIILEQYKKRKARYRISRVLEQVIDKYDTMDPLDIAIQLQNEMNKVIVSTGTSSAVNVVEEWQSIYDEVERRTQLVAAGQILGVPIGIPSLDEAMGGLRPEELIIVLGYQGEGKSWILSYLAVSALMAHKRVLFCSLEMPVDRISARIHTMMSHRLANGDNKKVFKNLALESGKGVDIKEYKKFLTKMAVDYKEGLYIAHGNVNRMQDVISLVEEVKPDIVFYDYVGVNIHDDNKSSQGWEVIGNEASLAKQIATRFAIPVVVAAQANRSAASQENAPSLASIARSYIIGQHADRCISLKLLPQRKELRIHLAKNRYGPPVDIECDWDVNSGIIKERNVKMSKKTLKEKIND